MAMASPRCAIAIAHAVAIVLMEETIVVSLSHGVDCGDLFAIPASLANGFGVVATVLCVMA